MRLDPTPLYRKVIIPWYDSGKACLATIAFMVFVFLFAITGILVACKTPEYIEHKWVPGLLAVMSGGVILSTSFRLIKRYAYKLKEEKEN
ncbi:hypothetical protein [Desulfonema magnum]|uniref:Uncharacterized protein n=1 Tax=Desulfonema magnum TaxID=45655 RepID=A0A975GKB5_9BACT|nr:hypothetical protein [Desulfonema magnum]QTA84569.1 Uncharacterized protein dnm_005670 [Desulfonema magnum]